MHPILRLIPVPMLHDNYLWLLVADNGATIAIDVGDYAVLKHYLQAHQLTLTTVLITHHHPDHTGGVAEIRQYHPNVPIYGHPSIQGMSHHLFGGEIIHITNIGHFLVMDVAGHTKYHLAFYHLTEKILFCGDTVFSAGCGRILGGDAQHLYRAIEKIKLLPDDTRLCPSHEYTLSNLEFACAIEPANLQTVTYQQQCLTLRANGLPTLPVKLNNEKAVNPFLRSHLLQTRIATLTDTACSTPEAAFVALRHYKNHWHS